MRQPIWQAAIFPGIHLAPLALVIAVLIFSLLWSRRTQPPPENGWKGIFYFNPEDPALWVPKRYGIGYTLNFGNPWSWIVLVVILIAAALPLVFIRKNGHPHF